MTGESLHLSITPHHTMLGLEGQVRTNRHGHSWTQLDTGRVETWPETKIVISPSGTIIRGRPCAINPSKMMKICFYCKMDTIKEKYSYSWKIVTYCGPWCSEIHLFLAIQAKLRHARNQILGVLDVTCWTQTVMLGKAVARQASHFSNGRKPLASSVFSRYSYNQINYKAQGSLSLQLWLWQR